MKKIDKKKVKETVENTIRSDIKQGKVGAAAVCVMQEQEICYQQYFSNDRLGISVSDNTLFRLASMTKPITAAAVLMLIDRGLLTLDTPVYQLIPEFQHMNIGCVQDGMIRLLAPAKTAVTIRHLLTHTSGIGSGELGVLQNEAIPVSERTTLQQAVAHYVKNPLAFEPFAAQSYSPVHAFDVLAYITELVSGVSFDCFLKKELFEPLGMTDTTFSPNEEQWKRMIPMHTYENGEGKIIEFPQNSIFEGYPTTYFCGGAGLAATLKDYMKFANLLLNHGSWNGRQLISEKMICEMRTPQVPETIMPGKERWGLGVRVITANDYGSLPAGAFGWSGAYGTHFWVDPVNQICAVYMKNSRYDGGSGARTAYQFEQDVYQM